MKKKIIIGTRGSKLALIQTQIVLDNLKKIGAPEMEIREIKTSGDRDRSRAVADIGGKGIFIKEIESELLHEKIDIAVHSLKDMPAEPAEGLQIGAFLKAEDNRDVLVSKDNLKLSELPKGAKVGTGSPRRRAQLRIIRSDIEISPIRGNVETRVSKVEAGDYDATILAAAGLKRLNLEDKINQFFKVAELIPAPGQGVIAVEMRRNNKSISELLEMMNDFSQKQISEIEFGLLRELGATCLTPIGMNSEILNDKIIVELFLAEEDGAKYIRTSLTAPMEDKNNAVKILLKGVKDEWKNNFGKELEVK